MKNKTGIQHNRQPYTPTAGAGIQPMKGEISLNPSMQSRVDLLVDIENATVTRDMVKLAELRGRCVNIGNDYLIRKIDKVMK